MYKISQEQQILNYLKQGHSLTQWDAANMFKCWRLSGRIKDLRDQGFDIETVIIHNENKHFASYRLRQEVELKLEKNGQYSLV